MVIPQILLAIFIFAIALSGDHFWLIAFFISALGLSFANIPIVWSTWGPKMVPDHTETIGGLYVALTQLSSASGALIDGILQE